MQRITKREYHIPLAALKNLFNMEGSVVTIEFDYNTLNLVVKMQPDIQETEQ